MIQKDFLINESNVNEVEVEHITKYELWQTKRVTNLNKPVCLN